MRMRKEDEEEKKLNEDGILQKLVVIECGDE